MTTVGDRDDRLEGRYANSFKIGFNAIEFLMDFGQFYPEGTEAQFHTRIVTSPLYAKDFLEILIDSIDRYQKNFGPIGAEDDKGPQNDP